MLFNNLQASLLINITINTNVNINIYINISVLIFQWVEGLTMVTLAGTSSNVAQKISLCLVSSLSQ